MEHPVNTAHCTNAMDCNHVLFYRFTHSVCKAVSSSGLAVMTMPAVPGDLFLHTARIAEIRTRSSCRSPPEWSRGGNTCISGSRAQPYRRQFTKAHARRSRIPPETPPREIRHLSSYRIIVNFVFGAPQTEHFSCAWPYTVLPQTSQTKMSCAGRSFPLLKLSSACE